MLRRGSEIISTLRSSYASHRRRCRIDRGRGGSSVCTLLHNARGSVEITAFDRNYSRGRKQATTSYYRSGARALLTIGIIAARKSPLRDCATVLFRDSAWKRARLASLRETPAIISTLRAIEISIGVLFLIAPVPHYNIATEFRPHTGTIFARFLAFSTWQFFFAFTNRVQEENIVLISLSRQRPPPQCVSAPSMTSRLRIYGAINHSHSLDEYNGARP